MTRATAWGVHLSALAVILTGLVYGWMCYLSKPADPYAVVNHPWQPTLQHLHVLAAPTLVFTCGVIWQVHVWRRFRSGRRRRRTGLLLALSLLPMIVSGYLVQVSVEEVWRQAWVLVHVVSSILWSGAYGWHQLSRVRRPRRRVSAGG